MKTNHPKLASVELLDETAGHLLPMTIMQLATGFQFTEGPVWHPGQYLLCSDTPVNKIFQILADGSTRLFLDLGTEGAVDPGLHSDMIGPNGLAMDRQGNLLICRHGAHAISLLKNGSLSNIVDQYQGKPLNSPNDLLIASDGTIYFTDPPYGLKDQVLNPSAFQSRAGIFRYRQNELECISTSLQYPNGICFSPRAEFLYVSSNHPDEPRLLRFTLSPGGEIQDEIVFLDQNADGIKTDQSGNLLLATNEGLLIVSPGGRRLARMYLPETPTNLAWEDDNCVVLYITARSSVYKITMSRAAVDGEW